MRRLLTPVVALSLLVAGFLPLAAPVTANVCDHATIVTNGRFHGTVAVGSTKRPPVVHTTVTVLASIAPERPNALAWTHELVVVSASTFASLTGLSATSPRAPPASLTSQQS